MAPIIYESVYLSNGNVFDTDINRPYIDGMTILRKNLKKEMDSRGWNATVLSERSGVPQPTIQRFLSGTHGDPRSITIQKLAKGLGLTEAVLRGFEEAELPVPLYENIEKLNEENRKLIEQMVNTLVNAQPKINSKTLENNTNKALTSPDENVGGGGQKPYQQPQAQDRRVANRRQLSQFEIELAIEQERCVMERHKEAIEINERYIGLLKESCKNNECYCEPPCKDVNDHSRTMSFKAILNSAQKRKEEK